MLGSSLVRQLREAYPDALLYSIKNKNPLPAGLSTLLVSNLKPESFDAVLHLASPASPANHTEPLGVANANIDLTYLTLRALMPGGFYAYLSSGEVYGPNAGSYVSEGSEVSPQLLGTRSYYPLSSSGVSFRRQLIRFWIHAWEEKAR